MVMWLRQISVDNRAASRAAYYGLGGMKILARFVRRELRLQAGKYGHCAVYEDELQRIWPIDKSKSKDRTIREGARVQTRLLQEGTLRDL
jgi:hypothetical protein